MPLMEKITRDCKRQLERNESRISNKANISEQNDSLSNSRFTDDTPKNYS